MKIIILLLLVLASGCGLKDEVIIDNYTTDYALNPSGTFTHSGINLVCGNTRITLVYDNHTVNTTMKQFCDKLK